MYDWNYKILRYFSDHRKPQPILTNVSLEIARLHCKHPDTKGTLRNGVRWFDGYTRKQGEVKS